MQLRAIDYQIAKMKLLLTAMLVGYALAGVALERRAEPTATLESRDSEPTGTGVCDPADPQICNVGGTAETCTEVRSPVSVDVHRNVSI